MSTVLEHQRRPRRRAAWRRKKRRALQYLLFFGVIIVGAFILRIIFSFGDYMPNFYEPKDFEREIKKMIEEKAGTLRK